MSGVARLLHERGHHVSGCDLTNSAVLDELASEGIEIFRGHDASHVEGAGLVLWSPAVPAEHVERRSAADGGVQAWDRPTFLGWLCDELRTVAVAGTHGKTTATSMLACVWQAAGLDAARLLGADVAGVGSNGHWGHDWLLLELDESYGTFAQSSPRTLAVLNIEADHLDHYGDVGQLERAFSELMLRTRGPIVVVADDPGAVRAAGRLPGVVTVGTTTGVAWQVDDVVLEPTRSRFTLRHDGGEWPIKLSVTGRHNILNAAAVVALAHVNAIGFDDVARGLESFRGAPRRFTYRGRWRDVPVYEDYAHLPGEIDATVATLREVGYQRPLVVFQPHRVTRTAALGTELGRALAGAHRVIVTGIYTAGEPNPLGVTGEVVAEAVRGAGCPVTYIESLADVAQQMDLGDADVVAVLGAGDVASLVDVLPGGVA